MPVDRGLCEADVTSLLRRWVGDFRRIDVTDDDRVSRKAEKEPVFQMRRSRARLALFG